MVRICIDCKEVYGCVVGTDKHLCLNCLNPLDCPNFFINPETIQTHGICPTCHPNLYKKEVKKADGIFVF